MKFIDCLPALKQGMIIQKNNGLYTNDRVQMILNGGVFRTISGHSADIDLNDLEREDWEIIT